MPKNKLRTGNMAIQKSPSSFFKFTKCMNRGRFYRKITDNNMSKSTLFLPAELGVNERKERDELQVSPLPLSFLLP